MPERRPAIERFREKCAFDPSTGCVIWMGGLTRGGQRESNCVYGSFWDEGRRFSAHRWACEKIHGKPIPPDWHAGHTCPTGPDTLCVQHVEPQEPSDNWKHRWDKDAAARSLERREAIAEGRSEGVPMFSPPDWLVGGKQSGNGNQDDCPF